MTISYTSSSDPWKNSSEDGKSMKYCIIVTRYMSCKTFSAMDPIWKLKLAGTLAILKMVDIGFL